MLTVLAGLMLLHARHCTEGMSAMPHAAAAVHADTPAGSCGSATTTTGVRVAAADPLTVVCPGVDGAGMAVVFIGSAPGSRGMGGLLATCLAFLVAVLATLLTLRRSRWQGLLLPRRSDGAAPLRAFCPRAPRLAELCLLRT